MPVTRGRTEDIPQSPSRPRSPSAPPAPQSTPQQESEASSTLIAQIDTQVKQHLSSAMSQMQLDLLAFQDRLLNAVTQQMRQQTATGPAHPPQSAQEPTPEPFLLRPTSTQPVRNVRNESVPLERGSLAPSSVDEAQAGHTKLKASDLPSFDGSPASDIDDFINQVDKIWRFSGASERWLLSVLPMILKKSALDWFTDIEDDTGMLTRWDQWKDALRNAFRSPNHEERLYHRMTRRRLQSDESFSQYFQDKVHLLHKMYGSTVSEQIKIQEVLMGIPTWMHALIKSSQSKNGSLEDFRRVLMDLEEGLRAQQRGNSRPPQQHGARPQNHSERRNNNQRASQTPGSGVYRGATGSHGAQGTPYHQRQNNPSRPNIGSDTCLRCGQKGHWASQCKNPLQQSGNARPATNTNTTAMPYNRWPLPQGVDKPVEPADITWPPQTNVVTTRARKKRASHTLKQSSFPKEQNTTILASAQDLPSSDSSDEDFAPPTPEPQLAPSGPEPLVTYAVPHIPTHEDRHSQHAYDKTPVYGKVHLQKHKALHQVCIDSGSSISLIDKQYLETFVQDFKVTPCSTIIVNSLSSGQHVFGATELEVGIREGHNIVVVPVRFYVINFSYSKVLIGNDVLRDFEAIINYQTKKVSLAHYPQASLDFTSIQHPFKRILGGIRKVRPAQVFTVKAQSTASLPVIVDGATHNDLLYHLAPDKRFRDGKSSGSMAHTIVQDNGAQLYAQFSNFGDAPMIVKPCEVLGSAQLCSDQSQAAFAMVQTVSTAQQQDDVEMFKAALQDANINSDLSQDQQDKLNEVLIQHRQAFAYGKRLIGSTDWAKLSLDTGNAQPISQAPYHASPAGRRAIEETIEELHSLGVIEDSTSPWASPVVLVKQGDKVRFCVDYRKLNEVTKMDQYPIPRPDDILNAFSGKQFFSTFDANKGFHQIECATEEDRDKLAFRTHLGLKRFTRMPFGIHKGPGVFQRLMDTVLAQCKWQFALAYIDDIIVFSNTFEDHCQHVATVLNRVIASGITLSLKKSFVGHQSIKALGHTVSNLGIGTAPANVAAIAEYPTPTNVKGLQRFMGMTVYYKKFLKDFGKHAAPLFALLKKDAPFKWQQEHQDAFEGFKKALTTAPVLAHPDYSKPFILHTDASTHGLGGILSQKKDGDTKEHPIVYISRVLAPAEKNYSATELECLAIVWSLKKLHPYLDGCKFELITDHSALQWILSYSGNNRRLSKWSFELQEYAPFMTIVHRPGLVHSNVDPLSRAALPAAENEPECNTVAVQPVSDDFLDTVRKAYAKDTQLANAWPAIMKNTDKPQDISLGHSKLQVINSLVYTTKDPRCIYIPNVEDLRLQLLNDAHDAMTAGHLGAAKTLGRLKDLYWWPNIAKDVAEYVQTCTSCQHNKASNQTRNSTMHPIASPPARWHTVTMDFTGPFPCTKEQLDMVTVVVDKFTKRLIMWPSKSTDTASDVAKQFMDHVVKTHGFPNVIISDRDAKFTSLFWKSLHSHLGIKLALSTAFHPQTDGQTERANRTIKEMLRHYITSAKHPWAQSLGVLEFAYNDSINPVTGFTPFELDTGKHPRTSLRQHPTDIATPVMTQEFLDQMEMNAEQARDAISKAQDAQDHFANINVKERAFQAGDYVRLSSSHLNPSWLSSAQKSTRKLQPKYYGPYKVLERIGSKAYKLDLPSTLKIHPVINVEYLLPYHTSPDKFKGRQEVPPPAVQIDGHEEYFIEEIVNERTWRNKPQFLVKWQGYADDSNTWLPLDEVEDTDAYDKWLQLQGITPASQ